VERHKILGMLYEYRCYDAMPGRLPDLHRRFETVTLRLFAKHGIEPVGFWVADVGASNQLHYILRWKDMAERAERWNAFAKDPEWQEGKTASEANGPLIARVVNEFWSPTHYSPSN
jgi:NIPSNAP